MTWANLDPAFRHMLETVCTDKQLEVLKLKQEGYGHRRIARILGISTAAVRARLDSAARRIQDAKENTA